MNQVSGPVDAGVAWPKGHNQQFHNVIVIIHGKVMSCQIIMSASVDSSISDFTFVFVSSMNLRLSDLRQAQFKEKCKTQKQIDFKPF